MLISHAKNVLLSNGCSYLSRIFKSRLAFEATFFNSFFLSPGKTILTRMKPSGPSSSAETSIGKWAKTEHPNHIIFKENT